MAKKDKLKSFQQERREFHDRVVNFFNTSDNALYNYKQVSAAVGANNPKRRALIVEILEKLAVDGFVAEVETGRFRALNRSTMAEGLFIRRSNGKNSVDIGAEDGEPIAVAERPSMATRCLCTSVPHAMACNPRPRWSESWSAKNNSLWARSK